MIVLFETPAGYAFFKLLDEKKIEKTENLYEAFQTAEGAQEIVKLKHFEKFTDTTDALAATTALVEGKVSKILKKALKKVLKDAQEQVLLADAKLGSAIKEKFNVSCLANTSVQELLRCMRSQMEGLLSGLPAKDTAAMALGLAHSLSRYKLKFSPDKVDTMIVQAICLLDELDKELNNYTMRCREWYGWHFPELGKIITDNIVFVKVVKLMGTRDNAATTDFSDILPEDIEVKVKETAEISMGTEISDDDITNIQTLCDQVLEITMYRSQLYDYLRSRMMAIAPNLTVLLGELIGARLISRSGSMLNLAKQPSSTLQIYGAEKALFRALKTHKDTPKYGLIYHANLVAVASNKNKGKMSRSLAAKASLAARVDALGEADEPCVDLGTEHRAKLETRLKFLEEGNLRKLSGSAKAKAKFEKYHSKKEVLQYPEGADSTVTSNKRKFEDKKPLIEDVTPESPKKKKIKVEVKAEEEDETSFAQPVDSESGDVSKKKKKKKKKSKVEEEEETATLPTEDPADVQVEEEAEVSEPVKKKKKKKKSQVAEDE